MLTTDKRGGPPSQLLQFWVGLSIRVIAWTLINAFVAHTLVQLSKPLPQSLQKYQGKVMQKMKEKATLLHTHESAHDITEAFKAYQELEQNYESSLRKETLRADTFRIDERLFDMLL